MADWIETVYIVLVVVRQGDEFLMVQESSKRGQLWYLPAGRVDRGETLQEAAIRETLEEAGLPIELDGILRFEHTLMPNGNARFRVIFTAHPLDDTPPRPYPNEHTLRADWVSLENMKKLPLRSFEVQEIFEHVAGGGAVYPLSLLTYEGAPFRIDP